MANDMGGAGSEGPTDPIAQEVSASPDTSTLALMNNAILRIGTQACEIVLKEGASRGYTRDGRAELMAQIAVDNAIPWMLWAEVARLSLRAARSRSVDLTPAENLLQVVVKLEVMARMGQHEGEKLPEDPAERLAVFIGLAMALGLWTHKVLGEAGADAVSDYMSSLQQKAASARTTWREPAREFLRPLMTKQPWHSNDKVAAWLEGETPELQQIRKTGPMPDRRQIAAWIGKERSEGGLPAKRKIR